MVPILVELKITVFIVFNFLVFLLFVDDVPPEEGELDVDVGGGYLDEYFPVFGASWQKYIFSK